MRYTDEGWYHDQSAGVAGDIYFMNETDELRNTNPMGPFDTFKEAKNDAIAWHQCDIDNAKIAIHNLRAMKKPKE